MTTAAVIATLVGTGISVYSAHQAGKTQSTIANFNAAQQEKQAKMQLMSMQAAANMQKRDAEANYLLRGAESQARMNNAKSIENQAEGQDRINRMNLRKRAEEGARASGAARAAIAASGAVESSGTPLDILAETAGTIQKDQEEQFYEMGLQRTSLLREAEMERLGGRLALAGATLDRNSKVAEAGLNQSSARAGYLAGLRGADLERLKGKAAKQAGYLQAGATLFSGVGDAAGMYGQYKPYKTS